MHRYHADNGVFYERPFRSAIKDSNHKIIFCGVVSHHQNYIVERKNKTLTLVYIALILHQNIGQSQ